MAYRQPERKDGVVSSSYQAIASAKQPGPSASSKKQSSSVEGGSEFLKNLGTGIESCGITASTHAEEKDTTPYGLIVSSAAANLH